MPPKIAPDTYIVCSSEHASKIIEAEHALIARISKANFIKLVKDVSEIPKGCTKTAATGDI